MRMFIPDYVLYDPYELLESCSEAGLSPVPGARFYIVDQSLYYEVIPLYSTDDGRNGYPADLSSLSSSSLLGGYVAN